MMIVIIYQLTHLDFDDWDVGLLLYKSVDAC